MTRNLIKKQVYFSNYEFVQGLLADMTKLYNISESAAIEQCVVDALLPNNETGWKLVVDILCNPEEGVGKTLNVIFNVNSGGIRWKSKHDNLKPLVEFACEESCYIRKMPTGEERELVYCYDEFEAVVERVEGYAKNYTGPIPDQRYVEGAKYGKDLLKILKNEPKLFNYSWIYSFLLEYWEDFKSWSRTYRLLSFLATLEKGWRNTPKTRIKLARLIKKVTEEWSDLG